MIPNSIAMAAPVLFLHPCSTSISLGCHHSLSHTRTRPFSFHIRASSALTSSTFSPGLRLSPQSHQQQFIDEDDEIVIGDCVVFGEGVFEDPYLEETLNSHSEDTKTGNVKNTEVKPENLIPEKWKEIQEEINQTKKDRRKLAQELEFGIRVEKNRKASQPLRKATEEEYRDYKKEKLSQLKPIVLDTPTFPEQSEEEDDEVGGVERDVRPPDGGRVVPRNPRWAVYGGSLDDISDFFNSEDYDPDSNAKNSEGRQKLLTKDEKFILNRRTPNLKDAASEKWLPLHTLVASGEFYLVNTLLKHGADINVQDKDGLTALHKATVGKKQAIFNYLLRESANPNIKDRDGATLMHYAVWTASTQMIKILLLYNVDINLPDNDGWTPLHLAVQSRRTDIVRLLLIKGADKMLKNKDGLTALDLALYSGHNTRTYELIKLIKQLPKPSRDIYNKS
ncbi:ankyrin repeat domain-containing protein, chloroplastic [Impatiens glandulifera]|uniref:ankyrin repeat domain-containing protein, chloroplastic n=1 Tax=Impatiens glandulifera TaxID=253017 RepID=UPI001FB05002|nr:ankyrin repeat domain-containing protein, chloroplastic [Impatiens glandulifera]